MKILVYIHYIIIHVLLARALHFTHHVRFQCGSRLVQGTGRGYCGALQKYKPLLKCDSLKENITNISNVGTFKYDDYIRERKLLKYIQIWNILFIAPIIWVKSPRTNV